MTFGGQLLKKKTRISTKKVEVSRTHLFGSLEPILRTLGYVKPGEEIIELDAIIPKTVTITIRKKAIESKTT